MCVLWECVWEGGGGVPRVHSGRVGDGGACPSCHTINSLFPRSGPHVPVVRYVAAHWETARSPLSGGQRSQDAPEGLKKEVRGRMRVTIKRLGSKKTLKCILFLPCLALFHSPTALQSRV